MKYLKMLALAALLAGALTAIAGAGTASAYKCTEKALLKCPTSKLIKKEERTLKPNTGIVLGYTSGESAATCTGSTFSNELETQGEKTASGAITALSWSGCTTTVDTLKLGKLEMTEVGEADEATVTGKETEITAALLGVSCTYGFGSGTTLGTTVEGEPAELPISAALNKVAGGFLCPGTIWLFGRHVVTNHKQSHWSFSTD